MMTVLEANFIPILIALLIGLAIGWWMFARRSTGAPIDHKVEDQAASRPPAPPPARTVPPPANRQPEKVATEGRGIADHGAAATADVTGQFLGVEVHSQLPGASGPPDDLQMLKGVGPKLAARLNENGIIRFDQIARLSPNEVLILEDKLGPFKGRLTRDRVVEQAAYLARGDHDGFEARFGNLGA